MLLSAAPLVGSGECRILLPLSTNHWLGALMITKRKKKKKSQLWAPPQLSECSLELWSCWLPGTPHLELWISCPGCLHRNQPLQLSQLSPDHAPPGPLFIRDKTAEDADEFSPSCYCPLGNMWRDEKGARNLRADQRWLNFQKGTVMAPWYFTKYNVLQKEMMCEQ